MHKYFRLTPGQQIAHAHAQSWQRSNKTAAPAGHAGLPKGHPFLRSQQCGRPAPTIRLEGSDERGVYRARPLDARKLVEKLATVSRAYLHNQWGEFASDRRLRQYFSAIGTGGLSRAWLPPRSARIS
jgi:hypothetical protein